MSRELRLNKLQGILYTNLRNTTTTRRNLTGYNTVPFPDTFIVISVTF